MGLGVTFDASAPIVVGVPEKSPPACPEWQPSITGILAEVPTGEPIWWVPVVLDNPNSAVINTMIPVPLVNWEPPPGDIGPDLVHPTAQGAAHWAAQVMAWLHVNR